MFNFITKKYQNNPELAYKILFEYSYTIIDKIIIWYAIKDCKCRQDILNKVIEICGEPTTPFQRYIYAETYSSSNAEYRQLAIKYIKEYIDNGLWEGAYINTYRGSIDATIEERKKEHLCDMYGDLFSAYMGTYEFDEALKIADVLLEMDISDPMAYMKKCEVLIKLNKLKDCKEWLEQTKKLPFYKLDKKYLETAPENWFYFTINRLLDDVNKKIEKGYVYKPRKKNK